MLFDGGQVRLVEQVILTLFIFGLHPAGAGFRSLTDVIERISPGGRMMMQIVGTFAEFERAIMLRERTRNGFDAAIARFGGRAVQSSHHSTRRITMKQLLSCVFCMPCQPYQALQYP